ARASAIGRSDFAQLRAALLNDIRNAKRPADFDELAARHQHLALRRNGGQKQQGSRGVVVGEQRALGSEQRSAKRFEVRVARATLARLEIEFEIRVALDEVAGSRPQCRIDWRTAEVGVNDDA